MVEIRERIELTRSHNIWITLADAADLAVRLDNLKHLSPDQHALWGIPFAIKDNIDLAGCPTTAGCPDFTYTPDSSASVVSRLIAAGAIPIGKTNLDQFATGLVGTRSPYGAVGNAVNPQYIAGAVVLVQQLRSGLVFAALLWEPIQQIPVEFLRVLTALWG